MDYQQSDALLAKIDRFLDLFERYVLVHEDEVEETKKQSRMVVKDIVQDDLDL